MVFNYKYFTEKIEESFNMKNDCLLSLIDLDIDDFRLYNQLYGNTKGNYTLIKIAAIINICRDQKTVMSVTMSAGIAVSPFTAKNSKELAESTDLTLYNTKMAGKGKVNIYRPHIIKSSRIAERVKEMIERQGSSGERSYEAYSKTILGLTAAIDAMTSDRPYRARKSVEYALSQIDENAGTQFDPRLAPVFINLVKSGEILVNPE